MSAEPKHVHTPSDGDSDLAELLDDASTGPVIIERDGVLYRLTRISDEGLPDYDPDYALRVLEETAGSWRDVDADALVVELHAARERGSRPPDRP